RRPCKQLFRCCGGGQRLFAVSSDMSWNGRPRASTAALIGFALVGGLSLGASPASATFPGTNGQVAYHAFFQQGQAVFGTSSGRITTPRTTPLPADFDLSPRWSPDGAQIAFVRLDALAHIARV